MYIVRERERKNGEKLKLYYITHMCYMHYRKKLFLTENYAIPKEKLQNMYIMRFLLVLQRAPWILD